MTDPNREKLPPTVGVTQAHQVAPSTADGKPTADSVAESRETVSHHPAAKSGKPVGEATSLPTIPGYEIEAVLGRGAMGVVYRARHLKLKRTVALKMILAGAHADEMELARFRSESEAVARLQHANIVGVYEVGEHNGLPYCALEYVDGGSLAQRLNRKPQPPADAVRILEALAEGMHLAHSRNVVHRDLKPANVLMTSDGVPKISDFGLARQLDVESGQTQTGAVLGTPAYMAPEQASGQAHAAGPAADVYALGAILYEALTGRPPFAGKSLVQILELVRTVDPIPPRRLQPQLSRDLETICLKCLNKEPEKRYASALELAEDLRRYRANEPIRARTTGRMERVAKWVKRRPAIAAMLAVMVFMTVVGFVAVLSQWVRAESNASAERTQRTKAEDAQKDAEDATALAKAAASRADRAKRDAQEKEKDANSAKDKEADAKNAALAAQQKSERNAAIQSLAAARFALDEHDLLRADEALDSCPIPQRGWAWRHLRHRRQSDLVPWALNSIIATKVAFSPNGRTIAIAANERGIILWDIVTCREASVINIGTVIVDDLTFSPDGKNLAAALADQGRQTSWVTIWNPVDGKQRIELKGHTGAINALAYSADGKRLATASNDKTVKLWDIADGTELFTLSGHTDRVLCVAFSPTGRHVVSGGADRTARVWDAWSGRNLSVNNRPGGMVTSVAVNPSSMAVGVVPYAAADSAGLVTISDSDDQLRAHTDSITRLRFSSDGRVMITASLDRTVRVFEMDNGVETFRLRGHTGAIRDADVSPDGRLLVTVGADQTVKLWDAWAGQSARMLASNGWPMTTVAYRSDSQAVAFGTRDGTVSVLEPHNGTIVFLNKRAHQGQVCGVAFDSDGTLLATTGRDGQLKVWDAGSGKMKYARQVSEGTCCMASSPTEPLLATSDNQSLRLWDPRSGEVKKTITDEKLGLDMAFSDDGKYLAIIRQMRLSVIEVGTLKNVVQVAGLDMPIENVAWRPKSNQVAVNLLPGQGLFEGREGFAHKGVVQVWDANTGQQVYALRNAGQRVAYTQDGRQLVSVGFDEARFWDAETGQEVFNLSLQNRGVDLVAFSPDGEQMLVATSNHFREPDKQLSIPGHVRIYTAPTRQPVTTLRQHLAPVRRLEFTERGDIYSEGEDGVRLWSMPNGVADDRTRPKAEVIVPSKRLDAATYNAKTGRLATGLADNRREQLGTVGIWDVTKPHQIEELPDYEGYITALAYSPDGKFLVTARSVNGAFAGRDPETLPADLTIWETQPLRRLSTFEGHRVGNVAVTLGVIFHPDGNRIASVGTLAGKPNDTGVLIWERETGKILHRLPLQWNPAFSADGKLLATTAQKKITVWNATTGEKQFEIGPLNHEITQVALRGNGSALAGVGGGVVMVWDLASRRELLTLRETCLPVAGEDRFRNQRENEAFVGATSVAFSPDGAHLAVGLINGTIKVWRLPLMAGPSGELAVRNPVGLDAYLNFLIAAEYSKARAMAAGSAPAAEQAFDRVLELAEALARDHPDDRYFALLLGRVQREIARYSRDIGKTERAEKAAASAATIWKTLGGEDTLEDRSTATLAVTCHDVTSDARVHGDLELARDACSGSVAVLEQTFKETPNKPKLREELLDAHGMHAVILVELKSYKDALGDWERAMELTGGQDPSVRLGRAVTLVRSGDHARATAEADALAQGNPPALTRLALARIFGRAAATVRDDQQITPEERDKLVERHSARAIELLKAAHAGGVFQDSMHANRLHRDKELDALRGRDDFKQLVEEVMRTQGS
jgi:WD40 repeat protein/tRNA A-37 threonylcarbamoyl transferase component Bud32